LDINGNPNKMPKAVLDDRRAESEGGSVSTMLTSAIQVLERKPLDGRCYLSNTEDCVTLTAAKDPTKN
jgi:hypothetical protein